MEVTLEKKSIGYLCRGCDCVIDSEDQPMELYKYYVDSSDGEIYKDSDVYITTESILYGEECTYCHCCKCEDENWRALECSVYICTECGYQVAWSQDDDVEEYVDEPSKVEAQQHMDRHIEDNHE